MNDNNPFLNDLETQCQLNITHSSSFKMATGFRLIPHTMEDLTQTTQHILEVFLYALLSLLSLTYGFIFYFRQRREHHVRTGSLKETSSQPFTSPHPGRKVTSYCIITKKCCFSYMNSARHSNITLSVVFPSICQ